MRHEVSIIVRTKVIESVGSILTIVILLLHLPAVLVAQRRVEPAERAETPAAAGEPAARTAAPEPDKAAASESDEEATRERERKPSPVGIGVGVAVERRLASDPDASDTWGVTFLPRFIARGFGPAFNFPWTETGAVREPGKDAAELAIIRMRPALGGVAWQQPLAHGFSVELRFLAGYSFNAIRDPKEKRRDARVVLPDRVTDIDNSVAWEPRVAIWRDIGPRVGLMLAGRYLHSRPRLTFADGTRRAWNADRVTIELGFAFTLVPGPPSTR